MEENRQEYDNYDNTEFEEDYTPRPDSGKSIRGYRIVIIILSVILVAISALYFGIHRQQMLDNELLRADRDSIQNDLGRLMEDYDNLHVANDSISASLDIERGRADSLMNQLRKERRWSLAKIKQYEKEVGTLRTVMRGYLHQIDSLNSLNQKLITENISYRKEISSPRCGPRWPRRRPPSSTTRCAPVPSSRRAASASRGSTPATRRFRASATPNACAWTSC